MNRREVLVGAPTFHMPALANVLRSDLLASGAIGDGVTDDAPAIQEALDRLGQNGGGVARLPQPPVHYRIGRGLKLPSNVVLEGTASVQYPFNAGNKGVCALVADFSDCRQWIIEPDTRTSTGSVPFNRVIGGALPNGVTYNCGVKDLLLTSKGKVPFGGIRMHGCPGSFVDGVSIDRVGCGLLVNHCSGGHYRANIRSLYYGAAVWDDANGNLFQIYCSQSTPWPKVVPETYRLPFMVQMGGHFADTLKLDSDKHVDRPYGLLCGSIASTSTGNCFDAVIEQFTGGVFLYNAYATDFRQCYLESENRSMICAIVASRSRFSIQALHAYLSGTGALFEFGIEVLVKIFASGILDTATFGKAPLDDGRSLIILEGVDPQMPGAPMQPGIRYLGKYATWTPLLLASGWSPFEEDAPAVRFDPWSHRVECRGSVKGGKDGICFRLPADCIPSRAHRYMTVGGRFEIGTDGIVRLLSNEKVVSLDGISFSRW